MDNDNIMLDKISPERSISVNTFISKTSLEVDSIEKKKSPQEGKREESKEDRTVDHRR